MHRTNNFAFIDGANLYLTYKNLDWKLDYAKLRTFLEKRLDVTVAWFFLGKNFATGLDPKELESYNYTVRLKNPSKHTDEEEYCPYCWKVIAPKQDKYKADCDSFMTFEIISNLHIYNQAVIITSDGDFDELVKELLLKNKLRMLLAPCRSGCSGLLKSAARHRIEFIDDYRAELEKI